MPAKAFTDQGMRFRAYLGWKTLASLGTLSTLNVIHTTFTTEILNKWADPSASPLRTLKKAFDDAKAIANLGSLWSGADDLAIYGYWGLLWQDTIL